MPAATTFKGEKEQRDLQRFLRKHHLPKEIRPLLPPKQPCPPRRFSLPSSKPHEEATLLRKLADENERAGQFLKARDCLHDLYLFDPSDAGIFQRARAIEEKPQFQSQLIAAMDQRRRDLPPSSVLNRNTFTI
jgi:hypothetical protein